MAGARVEPVPLRLRPQYPDASPSSKVLQRYLGTTKFATERIRETWAVHNPTQGTALRLKIGMFKIAHVY